MKRCILVWLLSLMGTHLFSQDILGKWYAVNRSGLIEMKFTNDSLGIQSVNQDLSARDPAKSSTRHEGIVALNDRILVVFKDKGKTNQFEAMTVFNFRDRACAEIAGGESHKAAQTIEELIELSVADTTQLYGYMIFHESFIPKLREMRSINEMTLQDFKNFLVIFIGEREKRNGVKDNMAGSLTYQLMTRVLFDIGYNPMITSDVVSTVFAQFSNDPGVKELLKKLK